MDLEKFFGKLACSLGLHDFGAGHYLEYFRGGATWVTECRRRDCRHTRRYVRAKADSVKVLPRD